MSLESEKAEKNGCKQAICSDEPICSASEDKLHRSELASQIATILDNINRSGSSIIGISGPWGSGKSSLVNLVESTVQNRDDNDNKMYKFIHFKPWMFSNQSDVFNEFFSTISPNIAYSHFERLKVWFKNHFGGYSLTVELPPMRLLLAYQQNLINPSPRVSLDKLKEKISNNLKQSKETFVVVIDDLDRLDVDEIKLIIKLVRAVADFDNVIYILEYDKLKLCKRLEYDFDSNYLDKIIQVEIKIPEINSNILSQ